MNNSIYPLKLEDEPFLWEMLFEAAHLAEEGETSVRSAMNQYDSVKPRRLEIAATESKSACADLMNFQSAQADFAPVDAVLTARSQITMNNPQLAKYVRNWGRENDLGFGAIDLETQEKIGAVWLRLFPNTDRGYGYIDDRTPELAIAVLPAYRGQGIGTRLLLHLLNAAKDLYPTISLSVRTDNPVIHLYRRLGFQDVAGSAQLNRTGGTSVTLKIDLHELSQQSQ